MTDTPTPPLVHPVLQVIEHEGELLYAVAATVDTAKQLADQIFVAAAEPDAGWIDEPDGPYDPAVTDQADHVAARRAARHAAWIEIRTTRLATTAQEQ